MSSYPYRYKYKNIATRCNGIGPYTARTVIIAHRDIIFEMLRLYRKHHAIKPGASLSDKGIWIDRGQGNTWGIIVTIPKDFPTKEEAESYPHKQIAQEITRLWRQSNINKESS